MPKPPRSPCPIACVLDLIGDRWTLLVVRDCLCGKSLFKEFLASPERIATNVLAERLTRLTEHGLLVRDGPAYRLTPTGLSLRSVMEKLMDWGLTNIPGTEARMRPSA